MVMVMVTLRVVITWVTGTVRLMMGGCRGSRWIVTNGRLWLALPLCQESSRWRPGCSRPPSRCPWASATGGAASKGGLSVVA